MKIHVFYKIAENPSGLSLRTSVREDTQGELEKLKTELSMLLTSKEEPKTEKINTIRRRIARLENFDKIKNSISKEPAIEKILANKSSDTYLWSDLLSLKRRGIDIASLVLIYQQNTEVPTTSTIKQNDVFTVNFGDNKHLNAQIWAGDILPWTVKEVRINGKIGTRKEEPRPGYYFTQESGKVEYLPIFDGDTLEIIRIWTNTEGDNARIEKASEERWRKLRANDMFDYNDKNPLTDLEEDKGLFTEVTRVAKERGVRKLDHMFSGWEKAKFALNSFVALWWTKEQSIGIVANLIWESNLSHTIDTWDGWRAYGIAQWHPDRQRNFAKVFGKPMQWSTLEEQISFVDWELRNTEINAWSMLRNAWSIEDATRIITYYYERPLHKEVDTQKRTVIARWLESRFTS